MNLSKHFTLEEMTRSMVASRKGINNIPGPGEIKNLGDLWRLAAKRPRSMHLDARRILRSMVYQILRWLTGSLIMLTLINVFWSIINQKMIKQAGSTYLMMKKDLTENRFLPLMVKDTLKIYLIWSGKTAKFQIKNPSAPRVYILLNPRFKFFS